MRRLIWASIPMHFLPLLEQKVGALDQAAPLQGWDLPGVFATLHRLLEARMGKKGKREYVQVLRLLESFEMAHALRGYQTVAGTGRDRLRCGQASGALPDREAPATARSRYLPVPSKGAGRDHRSCQLHAPDGAGAGMTDTPQVLLQHHLKKLRLPTFHSEYAKQARQCAVENKDHINYLLRALRAGTDRARTPDDRAPDQGRKGSRRPKAWTASTSRSSRR